MKQITANKNKQVMRTIYRSLLRWTKQEHVKCVPFSISPLEYKLDLFFTLGYMDVARPNMLDGFGSYIPTKQEHMFFIRNACGVERAVKHIFRKPPKFIEPVDAVDKTQKNVDSSYNVSVDLGFNALRKLTTMSSTILKQRYADRPKKIRDRKVMDELMAESLKKKKSDVNLRDSATARCDPDRPVYYRVGDVIEHTELKYRCVVVGWYMKDVCNSTATIISIEEDSNHLVPSTTPLSESLVNSDRPSSSTPGEVVMYPTQYLYVIRDHFDSYEFNSHSHLSDPINAQEFTHITSSLLKRIENPLISGYFDTYSNELQRFIPTEELLYEYPLDFEGICPNFLEDELNLDAVPLSGMSAGVDLLQTINDACVTMQNIAVAHGVSIYQPDFEQAEPIRKNTERILDNILLKPLTRILRYTGASEITSKNNLNTDLSIESYQLLNGGKGSEEYNAMYAQLGYLLLHHNKDNKSLLDQYLAHVRYTNEQYGTEMKVHSPETFASFYHYMTNTKPTVLKTIFEHFFYMIKDIEMVLSRRYQHHDRYSMWLDVLNKKHNAGNTATDKASELPAAQAPQPIPLSELNFSSSRVKTPKYDAGQIVRFKTRKGGYVRGVVAHVDNTIDGAHISGSMDQLKQSLLFGLNQNFYQFIPDLRDLSQVAIDESLSALSGVRVDEAKQESGDLWSELSKVASQVQTWSSRLQDRAMFYLSEETLFPCEVDGGVGMNTDPIDNEALLASFDLVYDALSHRYVYKRPLMRFTFPSSDLLKPTPNRDENNVEMVKEQDSLGRIESYHSKCVREDRMTHATAHSVLVQCLSVLNDVYASHRKNDEQVESLDIVTDTEVSSDDHELVIKKMEKRLEKHISSIQHEPEYLQSMDSNTSCGLNPASLRYLLQNECFDWYYASGLEQLLSRCRQHHSDPYVMSLMRDGNVAMLRYDYEHAIKQFKRVSLIDNTYSEAYSRIADCYAHLGDDSESIRYNWKSLEVDPEHHSTLFNLAYGYEKLKHVSKTQESETGKTRRSMLWNGELDEEDAVDTAEVVDDAEGGNIVMDVNNEDGSVTVVEVSLEDYRQLIDEQPSHEHSREVNVATLEVGRGEIEDNTHGTKTVTLRDTIPVAMEEKSKDPLNAQKSAQHLPVESESPIKSQEKSTEVDPEFDNSLEPPSLPPLGVGLNKPIPPHMIQKLFTDGLHRMPWDHSVLTYLQFKSESSGFKFE